MHWITQAGLVVLVILACWGLGYLWPIFAFPIGQAVLLLVWGLAPWWAIIPAIALTGLLLGESFGGMSWPYVVTFALCSFVAIVIGPWWRAGRGWTRALVITPMLLLAPWLLWRLILAYSPLSTAHLGWFPPGLLSMTLIWGTVLYLRTYERRRQTYSITAAPGRWRSTS